ncbi:MAG: PPC domain-containing protein, partial [Planctomycetes bacterium]|nr:PPC domain-containing protein [Planctomycetota bacterium]
FYNAEGASNLRPFVVGTLPEIVERETNDSHQSPQAIESTSAVLNGRLAKSGDVDTFSVELQAGQTLVASVDANRTLGSPMDGVLQIVSPEGFTLAHNDDDRGVDPQIVFVAPADGTYLVRIFAFPAAPNSSIRLAGGADYLYRLTLTTGPFVDHVQPLAVAADAEATVKPVGWNLPPELHTLSATAGAAGDPLAVWHPSLGNTATVAVVPHAVTVETTAAAEVGDDAASAAVPQPLVPPITVSGCVAVPGERDLYELRASKGEKLVIHCDARSSGSPLDPVLEVIDSDGKAIKRIDDAGRNNFDPSFTFAVPVDGVYRVAVSDVFGHGSFRHVYRLSVAAPRPDHGLTLAADRFQLQADKPLEIPVTVTRSDGFDGEIKVQLEGLPEGVESAAVVSPPKGAEAKGVKLVVKATPDVQWSGPVRVMGVSGDGPPRAATAAIAGVSERTTAIWLTIRGAAEKTAAK